MIEAVRMTPERERAHCQKYERRIKLAEGRAGRLQEYIDSQKSELKQWKEVYEL